MNFKEDAHYRLYYYSSGKLIKWRRFQFYTQQEMIDHIKRYFGLKHSITTFVSVYWKGNYNDDIDGIFTYKDYLDKKF